MKKMGTGQLNCDRRIYVFFIGMKRAFQNSSHISWPVPKKCSI